MIEQLLRQFNLVVVAILQHMRHLDSTRRQFRSAAKVRGFSGLAVTAAGIMGCVLIVPTVSWLNFATYFFIDHAFAIPAVRSRRSLGKRILMGSWLGQPKPSRSRW